MGKVHVTLFLMVNLGLPCNTQINVAPEALLAFIAT